jgi:hypothetical protein
MKAIIAVLLSTLFSTAANSADRAVATSAAQDAAITWAAKQSGETEDQIFQRAVQRALADLVQQRAQAVRDRLWEQFLNLPPADKKAVLDKTGAVE